MQVKRLTLAAGVETAFEFDNYAANSVVVKNETAGEILFCDGPFDAAKAAHIPAFSWQSFIIQVFYGEKPKFYVKAASAGAVEIDFGSVMAGCALGDGFGKLAGSSGVATGGTVTTLVDATKNLPADLVKDQYIAIIIDGVEYVRKISANNANTFTFDVLVPKAAATAVVEKSGGGKVTITATPEGSYANEYEVAVVQGEGASAETEAVFEDGVLTITLGTDAGTAASAKIGSGANKEITITAKEVGVLGGHSIEVALGSGNDLPLAVGINQETGLITVTLGTDGTGAADATKNKASQIAAALNDNIYIKALFTAVADGDGTGVFSEAIAETDIEGGVDPVIDATAAEVAAEVDALEGFSAVATVAGVLEALAEPVAFSGGVDEVKPAAGDAYAIKAKGGVSDVQISGPVGIDPAANAVQLSGSILAKDEDGNSVPLTVEKDEQGNAVLRIIDSAPWGYDPILDARKVISLGDRKLVVVSVKKENTLANKDDSSYPDYNNSDILEIKPPAGKIWEMKHFSFNTVKPSAAALGDHQIFIRYGTNAAIATVLSAKATYLGGLEISSGVITNANDTQVPNDILAQKLAMQNLYATYANPIYIKYQNQTDVQQTQTRNYYYVVIERNELP